ncbi:MAG: hypothetical protein WC812_04260 [Candidatus Pacearchaeota archaeon]|jgi:hypothetical protein
MEKIKKVNSLEELNNLKENTLIKVKNVLEGSGRNTIYLRKEFNLELNKNIYYFLSSDVKYPQDRTITEWYVYENDLIFKNESIDLKSYNQDFYHPMQQGFDERLEKIREALEK